MSLISDLAAAITRQEGTTRNNNPGNIWDGTGPSKPNRIWPDLPIDGRGFVVYPSLAAGQAALENDLSIKVNRGMTLSSLLTMYAPPSENDTATYIANVSAWTGIPTNVPLNTLGGSPAGGFDLSAPLGIPGPSGDSGISEAGTVDWGALALLGVAGLGLWLTFRD